MTTPTRRSTSASCPSGRTNPTARVEYALRADEALSEPQVRQIMEYYLAVRMRRFGRTYSSVGAAESGIGSNGSASSAGTVSAVDRQIGAGVSAVRRRSPAPPPRYGAVRPAVAAADPNAGSSLAHSRARPGSSLHVRVSGTANAGSGGPAFAILERRWTAPVTTGRPAPDSIGGARSRPAKIDASAGTGRVGRRAADRRGTNRSRRAPIRSRRPTRVLRAARRTARRSPSVERAGRRR